MWQQREGETAPRDLAERAGDSKGKHEGCRDVDGRNDRTTQARRPRLPPPRSARRSESQLPSWEVALVALVPATRQWPEHDCAYPENEIRP